VIFAAGTGIIPFLDLVSFTLRYMIHRICNEKYNYSKNKLFDNEKEEMEASVGPDYKLEIFYSVQDKSSAVFLKIIDQMQELETKYKLNVFKINFRFSTSDKRRWDTDFINSCLKSESSLIEKVYIVGPVGFMDDIRDSLLESAIVSRKHMVFV
jgi:hypothetical protein